MASTRTTVAPPSDRVRLIVASSVMLTFISFWRAAAIVLNDLGSSAFYAGGIAEQAVGALAGPGSFFGIMLFSFAVRAVSVESCSMFKRGGVYRVVKRLEHIGKRHQRLLVCFRHHRKGNSEKDAEDHDLQGPSSSATMSNILRKCVENQVARQVWRHSRHVFRC